MKVQSSPPPSLLSSRRHCHGILDSAANEKLSTLSFIPTLGKTAKEKRVKRGLTERGEGDTRHARHAEGRSDGARGPLTSQPKSHRAAADGYGSREGGCERERSWSSSRSCLQCFRLSAFGRRTDRPTTMLGPRRRHEGGRERRARSLFSTLLCNSRRGPSATISVLLSTYLDRLHVMLEERLAREEREAAPEGG